GIRAGRRRERHPVALRNRHHPRDRRRRTGRRAGRPRRGAAADERTEDYHRRSGTIRARRGGRRSTGAVCVGRRFVLVKRSVPVTSGVPIEVTIALAEGTDTYA